MTQCLVALELQITGAGNAVEISTSPHFMATVGVSQSSNHHTLMSGEPKAGQGTLVIRTLGHIQWSQGF